MDPLEALLKAAAQNRSSFPASSRYHGIEIAVLETEKGKPIVYLRRRFVPPAGQMALLQEHRVSEGERLDQITAKYLGDPEAFWQVADANAAMHPEELTTSPGRRLRITLPKGIPGNPNA